MRAFVLGLLVLAACQTRTAPAGPEPRTAASPTPAAPPAAPAVTAADAEAMRSVIERVAKGYTWLGRADGIYWAPYDCKAPPPPPAFVSAAPDGDHARKLYHLLIQSPDAYANATGSSLPSQVGMLGHGRDAGPWTIALAGNPDAAAPEWSVFRETEQVLVKESYAPHECADGPRAATVGGHTYCLDRPTGLFVMVKPKVTAMPTDDGWIYGTFVSGTVTSSGLVASCMGCHQKAPHGRLFGLPK